MAYTYPSQPAFRPYPVRTSAPLSLHLVAAVQYLGGLLTLALAAVLGLAAADLIPRFQYTAGDTTWVSRPDNVTPLVAVICAVFAAVGLTAIVMGRKLQRGRNWARLTLTVLYVLSAAGSAWQAFTLADLGAPALVSILVPALFIVLLNTRAARAWCRHRTY